MGMFFFIAAILLLSIILGGIIPQAIQDRWVQKFLESGDRFGKRR